MTANDIENLVPVREGAEFSGGNVAVAVDRSGGRRGYFGSTLFVKIGKEDPRNSSNLSGFRTSSRLAPSLKRVAILASVPCQLNNTPIYLLNLHRVWSYEIGERPAQTTSSRLHGLIQLRMRQYHVPY
jgi:hypothetical protein